MCNKNYYIILLFYWWLGMGTPDLSDVEINTVLFINSLG